MKRNFSPLDEFVEAHTTAESIRWLSQSLWDACGITQEGEAEHPEYALGLLANLLIDASHVARLLDKRLNPEDKTTTIVA